MTDRAENDLYPTNPELCWGICARLRKRWPGITDIIEPSAGPGNFVRAARAHWPAAIITAVDIERSHRTACTRAGADFFFAGDWVDLAPELADARRKSGSMLIFGNPPYSRAQRHIEVALDVLRDGEPLVQLLRLGFLASRKRAASFWSKATGLEELQPLVPRPSFVGALTTSTDDYATFAWRKGCRGRAQLVEPLVWREDLVDFEEET